eukprot:gene17830-21262_t
MRKIFLTLSLFLTSVWLCQAQDKIKNPKLQAYIDSLFMVDQKVQWDIVSAYNRHHNQDSLKLLMELKEQTFKRHTLLIKHIYKENGYPSTEFIGQESVEHFFLLIQHSDADLDFQSEMLLVLKERSDLNLIKAQDYAFLYDRVHINKGEEQLYGTQVGYDKEGNAFSKRLKDPATVDERRKKLGMEKLQDYLTRTTALHKEMNKKN